MSDPSPALPPAIPPGATHYSYPQPQVFDGVGWRDHSNLTERVKALEVRLGKIDDAKTGRTAWLIPLVANIFSVLLASGITYALTASNGTKRPEEAPQATEPRGQSKPEQQSPSE